MEAIIQEIKAALEAADPNITVVEVKRVAADHGLDTGDSLRAIDSQPKPQAKTEPA